MKGGQKKLGNAAWVHLEWVPKVITGDSNYRDTHLPDSQITLLGDVWWKPEAPGFENRGTWVPPHHSHLREPGQLLSLGLRPLTSKMGTQGMPIFCRGLKAKSLYIRQKNPNSPNLPLHTSREAPWGGRPALTSPVHGHLCVKTPVAPPASHTQPRSNRGVWLPSEACA